MKQTLAATRQLRPVVVWWPALAGLAVALGAWDLYARSGLVERDSLPTVVEVSSSLAEGLGTAELWTAIGQTAVQWGFGLLAACALGVPLGLVIGMSRTAYAWSRSTIDFLRAVPPIVLLPLFVLIFGSQVKMVSLLVLYGASWPLLVQTIDGVRHIRPATLDTPRVFHVGRARTFAKVVFPATLAYTMNGLRTAAVLAIFITFACELIAGSPGVGTAIARAQLGGDVAMMYALIAIAGLIGLVINAVFGQLERLLTPWSATQQRRNG